MKPARDVPKLVKDLRHPASAQTHDRIVGHLLDVLKRSKPQTAVQQPTTRKTIMKNPLTRLAVAAAIIVAACFGVRQFGGSLDGASVAWADVAERFESVPFFHLTIYLGQNDSEEARKIEIWKSETPLIRAHEGNKVLFARPARGKPDAFDLMRDNEGVVAFDRSTRQPVDPSGPARMFLGLLCPEGRFSLDTLMSNLGPADTTITAMETADTPASKETVLFEASHKSTPERLQIWALRTSRLPVRLRFSDSRNGECADFLFDYSQRRPPTFFDPNAFTSGREN